MRNPLPHVAVLLLAAAVVACGDAVPPTDPMAADLELPLLAQKAHKVDICHRTGKPGKWLLLNVSARALGGHLGHGDGQPGSAVPGMTGAVFCAECTIQLCSYSLLRGHTFGPEGGAGEVSYVMSSPACDCSGEVVEGAEWLTITGASAEGQLCRLSLYAEPWPDGLPFFIDSGVIGQPPQPHPRSRASVETPAGIALVRVVDTGEGGNGNGQPPGPGPGGPPGPGTGPGDPSDPGGPSVPGGPSGPSDPSGSPSPGGN